MSRFSGLARLSAEARFVDLRTSARVRVQCPAWIDLGDGSRVQGCTLLDVSDGGAKISSARAATLPNEFFLVITSDGSVRRRCRVIWRADDQLGLRYVSGHMLNAAPAG